MSDFPCAEDLRREFKTAFEVLVQNEITRCNAAVRLKATTGATSCAVFVPRGRLGQCVADYYRVRGYKTTRAYNSSFLNISWD